MRILLAGSAAVVLALTACSSSKSTTTTPPAAGGSSSSSSAASSSSSGPVTITLDNGVLVGPNGHTQYFNTVDTATSITCTGGCASIWPPLTGTAKAGNGVDQEDFKTATRPDGTTQITYYGHPLYYFAQDAGMTDKKGDGLKDGGGTWHATTPKLAEQMQPSGAASSSSSGGYGNGY
jgi:predicted lipoprotein with Yx(FWY)xxD motif